MFSKIRATHAEIRLSNLAHNFRFLRSCLKGSSFICPMIKAQAYGHGDIECAQALETAGAHDLGVSLVEEGIRLRQADIGGAIFVFGTFDREAISEVIKYNLTPVFSRWSDVRELEDQVTSGNSHAVHIKFNTGMNRLGFAQDEARDLAAFFKKSKALNLTGICTHLLNGEDAGARSGYSDKQITEFEEVCTHFEKNIVVHALNSSALCSQSYSGLGARPGIALYGSMPTLLNPLMLDLLPVMSLKSRIEHLQRLKKGEVVSYGGTWRAERDSIIGIVPVGYADGYPRSASNKSQMLVRGRRVGVAGIVCMDYTMLDLTDLHEDRPIVIGEEVVIFGRQGKEVYSADELAQAAGTISYEIFTRVSGRVPRIYLQEGV